MSIALSLGNNLTTGGVFKAAAVNNTSCNNITDFASVTGAATLVLLSTQTASASSSISFTTGIDGTYDAYIFKFINIHPATDTADFEFNFSTDGGSNYNVTKTSTAFYSYHGEDDDATELSYYTALDLAQSTSYQKFANSLGNDNDQSLSGYLKVFSPSSTTYVKQYIAETSHSTHHNYSFRFQIGGYGNTTSAINAIDFKMSTGNIDAGIIKMYGLVKS